MARRFAIVLFAAALLAACGGDDGSSANSNGAVGDDLSGLEATTARGGANAARMAALDAASQQFCLARQGGQAQLKRFLDRVAACSSGGNQAQNRCSSLGVDENRLRSVFAANATVLGVLDRAKVRPWPDCPMLDTPPQEEEPEEEPAEEEEEPASEDAAPAEEEAEE